MFVCFTRDPELGDSIPNIAINGVDIERVEHAKVSQIYHGMHI